MQKEKRENLFSNQFQKNKNKRIIKKKLKNKRIKGIAKR